MPKITDNTQVKTQAYRGGEEALVLTPDNKLARVPFETLRSDKINYQTKDQMDNEGAPANGQMAHVWNDETDSKNGEYGWSGSEWKKSKYDIVREIEKAKEASERAEQLANNIQKKRGSIRFYQRNGWDDFDQDSGHIWQPKGGVPNLFERGSTNLLRFSMPWEVMNINRRFQLWGSGSGSGGRTFSYRFCGAKYFDVAKRNCFEISVGHNDGGYNLLVGPLTTMPRDILLAHSTDNDGNVNVYIINASNGVVESIGSTTSSNTTGMDISNDGLSIGAWYGDKTTPVGQGQPNTSWCGSIAEITIVESVITEAEAESLIGGSYDGISDKSKIRYCRDFSRTDYNMPFASNDYSVPCETLGRIDSGSTVGMQSGLYIQKKPIGYIAGIKPGGTSASTEFNITSNGVIEGALFARVVSNGITITEYTEIGSIEPGNSNYVFSVPIPVTPSWCAVEFKFNETEFILADPIAAGIKISLIGQSQLEILLNYDVAAGVQQTSKFPASYCYHNEDDGDAEMYIIDNNPIADGLSGFIHHCNKNTAIPVCIIANVKEGSGVDQLCDDSNAERKWSWTEKLTSIAGSDVSAHLYQWGTNNSSAAENFGDEILTPLVEGIATSTVPVLDHYLYDGQTFNRDAIFILSPLTGHRTSQSGPLDYDNTNYGHAGESRQSQIEWATARDITIGPFINDLPTGGPHQYTETPKGNWRFGVRLAEAVLRGMGLSHRKNPEIESFKWVGSSRNQIDVRVKLPNRGALQTDGGDPKWGFEFDDGSGRTRLGFTAQIINPLTVRLTKDAGDWPDSTVWYYQFGGPLGYGTSISEYETCAGQLYDGVGMDGTVPGDNLGAPVASSQNSYSVE